MVKVGDRVEIESERVGQPPRMGLVTALSGHLVTIRWEDGRESMFVPQAGALRVVAPGDTAPRAHE